MNRVAVLLRVLCCCAAGGPVAPRCPSLAPPKSAQAAWKEATAGYTYAFPRDHASHPDYKIEWWYYTGNVKAKDGRRFGYQVTFFRVGIDPAPTNPSKWAVRDLFMTHLAISDPSGQRYRYAEKLSRGGPGSGRRRDRSVPRLERRLVGDSAGSGSGSADASRHVLKAASPQAVDRPHARRRQGAGHPRHWRHQPEGRAGRQRVALLLAHAHADARLDHRRWRALRGHRRQLDGSRVRHQLSRARPARLGLAVDSTRPTAAS